MVIIEQKAMRTQYLSLTFIISFMKESFQVVIGLICFSLTVLKTYLNLEWVIQMEDCLTTDSESTLHLDYFS